MNHLIEVPHPLQTTDLRTGRRRLTTPRPGDPVDFSLLLGQYPANQRYGTICGFSEGEVNFCCEPGSIFICDDGNVSISGGPFASCLPRTLIAAHDLCELPLDFPLMRRQSFWNWGNNGSGAGNAVHYHVDRPVFLATSITGYRKEYEPAYSEASGFTLPQWERLAAGVKAHLQSA